MLKTPIKLTAAIVLSGLLTACGGGSGSKSANPTPNNNTVTFTGITSQAHVSQTNAPDLTKAVLSNGTIGAKSTTVAGVTTQSTESPLPTQALSQLFLQLVTEQVNPFVSTSVTGVMIGPETKACTGGGTITTTIDVNQSTGRFTGTVDLAECVEDGQTSNGTLKYSGTIDVNLGTFTSPLLFTFSRLNVTTVKGADTTLNGSMECDLTNLEVSFSCTENFDLRDNKSGETFRTENLRISIFPATGGTATAISGKFYHPAHGFVEVVTDTNLFTSNNDTWPSSGVIRLLGVNGSKARITALSSTQYMLEIDKEGDNVYETNTIENWPS